MFPWDTIFRGKTWQQPPPVVFNPTFKPTIEIKELVLIKRKSSTSSEAEKLFWVFCGENKVLICGGILLVGLVAGSLCYLCFPKKKKCAHVTIKASGPVYIVIKCTRCGGARVESVNSHIYSREGLLDYDHNSGVDRDDAEEKNRWDNRSRDCPHVRSDDSKFGNSSAGNNLELVTRKYQVADLRSLSKCFYSEASASSSVLDRDNNIVLEKKACTGYKVSNEKPLLFKENVVPGNGSTDEYKRDVKQSKALSRPVSILGESRNTDRSYCTG